MICKRYRNRKLILSGIIMDLLMELTYSKLLPNFIANYFLVQKIYKQEKSKNTQMTCYLKRG